MDSHLGGLHIHGTVAGVGNQTNVPQRRLLFTWSCLLCLSASLWIMQLTRHVSSRSHGIALHAIFASGPCILLKVGPISDCNSCQPILQPCLHGTLPLQAAVWLSSGSGSLESQHQRLFYSIRSDARYP